MQPTDRQTVIKWQRATEDHNANPLADHDADHQAEHEDGDEQGAVIETVEPAAEASEDVDPFTAAVAGEE